MDYLLLTIADGGAALLGFVPFGYGLSVWFLLKKIGHDYDSKVVWVIAELLGPVGAMVGVEVIYATRTFDILLSGYWWRSQVITAGVYVFWLQIFANIVLDEKTEICPPTGVPRPKDVVNRYRQ